MKRKERGYLVVFAIFGALVATIIASQIYLWWVTKLNYEVAMLNFEAMGYYQVVMTVDMSPFNWAITALSGAFAIAAAAQARKKAINNVYEYMEEFLIQLGDKYGVDAISPILQTFISSNSNIS